jgi:NAD(P)-dependent dehydrogenase (short-subunit alcohol dehydrogenase family)
MIEDKVAIVTGAGRGMGRATALALAGKGAKVVLASRSEDSLSYVADRILQAGGVAWAHPTDITDEHAVDSLVKEVLARSGRIDILVNVAGVGFWGPVVKFTTGDWDAVFNTNLRGLFFCTRAVLPQMIAGKSGHIVNIASIAGHMGTATRAAYCASKAGVIRFSEALSEEVRGDEIKVSVISPGSTNTSFGGGSEADWKMEAEDVAASVVAVLSASHDALLSEVVMRPLNPRRGGR